MIDEQILSPIMNCLRNYRFFPHCYKRNKSFIFNDFPLEFLDPVQSAGINTKISFVMICNAHTP